MCVLKCIDKFWTGDEKDFFIKRIWPNKNFTSKKKSKLHLNKSGTTSLSSNFVKAISIILDWYEIEGNDKRNSAVE